MFDKRLGRYINPKNVSIKKCAYAIWNELTNKQSIDSITTFFDRDDHQPPSHQLELDASNLQKQAKNNWLLPKAKKEAKTEIPISSNYFKRIRSDELLENDKMGTPLTAKTRTSSAETEEQEKEKRKKECVQLRSTMGQSLL